MSEDAAYRRIRAARAIQKFPPILNLMREGRLKLEVVSLLHPYLDDPDAAVLITRCFGLRKWQVQALLAGRQTEPAKRDVVRFCGGPNAIPESKNSDEEPLFALVSLPLNSTTQTAPPKESVDNIHSTANPPPELSPATPPSSPKPTVRVSFSADEDFYKLMQQARSLLRHKYPDGRLEGVLKDALVSLLSKKDRGFGWRAGNARGRAPARSV